MEMDRNYNHKIIRKLVKRQQQHNHIRNLLACITIALSTALIFAFILYLFGTQEEKVRNMENTPQVSYQDITISQVEILRQDKRIQWIGSEVFVGRGKVGNTRLSVSWQDEAYMIANKINYTGALPVGANEIMIPKEYLKNIGKEQLNIGDTVSLDLGDKSVRDYQIAAIITDDSEAENSQNIYVSLPCAMMLKGQLGEELVNASVNMKDAINFEKEEAEKQAKEIADNASISQEQMKFNENYYMQAETIWLTITDLMVLVLIILLILAAAYIVIYSIFYISIVGKVREYGQMRTIGMTKKQVKMLILEEGLSLAGKGSFFGLFLGGYMGYALVPNGFSILNTIYAAIISTLLSIFFVGISVRKPGKIAAEASPIMALKYTGYTPKNNHKKCQHNLTPKYLAELNLKRNRKKSAWTMCSLILAGILLGTIASHVISYDPAAAVEYSFPEGQYQLMLSPSLGFGSDRSIDGRMKMYSKLQAEEVMGQELKKELEGLHYIENVQPWYYLTATTTLFQGEVREIGLNGISEKDFELLKKMSYEGPDSYEELLKQPGLIIENEQYGQLRKKPLSIGDEVSITFYNGKGKKEEQKLPVIATVKINSWHLKNRKVRLPLSLLGSSFMMPNTVMNQWIGADTTYGYEITVQKKNEKAAGRILEKMYGPEETLYLASKAENREYYEKQYFSAKLILYALAIFIVIFGIINLINTIITNLYSRRKEFGILQAIGMTEEQLKDMLRKENLYYTGITSFCTLFFGSILGYAFVMVEIQMGKDMVYSYPWLPILLYILGMLIIQKSFTDYGVKLLQKQSLTDRMKFEQG